MSPDTQPTNHELEQRILGALLNDPSKLEAVSQHIAREDFESLGHGLIFDAITKLHESGGDPRDYVAIHDIIRTIGRLDALEAVGGFGMLSEIRDQVWSAAEAETDARQIANAARHRYWQRVAQQIAESVQAGDDPEAIRATVEESTRRADRTSKPAETAGDFIRRIQVENETFTDRMIGADLAAPFDDMAREVDGLRGLTIIGASENAGKSVTAVNIGISALQANPDIRLVYFTLDDDRRTALETFVSAIAWQHFPKTENDLPDAWRRHRHGTIKRNNLRRASDDPRLNEARGAAFDIVAQWADSERFQIHDLPDVADDRRLESLVQRSAKDGPTICIVDAAYNLEIAGEYATIRELNIARANRLKAITTALDIPMIVTAEIRKAQGTNQKPRDADNPPTVADLMESSKYAYAADLVLMLYPEDHEMARTSDSPRIIYDVQKNKLSEFRGRFAGTFHRSAGVIEGVHKMTDVDEYSAAGNSGNGLKGW